MIASLERPLDKMLLKYSIVTLIMCGVATLATPIAEPEDPTLVVPEHKEPALPHGGGQVTGGSQFDREMAKVVAGKKDNMDWSHYKLENGTWVYSKTPVDHKKNSKRSSVDWGTICLYTDSRTCSGGTYYCWHSLDDGDCFSVYNDAHTYNLGFRLFYCKFYQVNFWTCYSDGRYNCASNCTKYGDNVNGQCKANPTGYSWMGMFKWHA
jgi:hypothetical protein